MDTFLLAQATFNPGEGIANIRALLIVAISAVLVLISLIALFGGGRQGNSSKVMKIIAASALALIPLVIALGVGAVAFGQGFIEWLLPSFLGG